MVSKQQPHKMPIYKQADFECMRCESNWQADYSDIAKLRANHPINCKNCKAELIMEEAERQILNGRFAKSEKLSKRALYFIIPYFIICAIMAITYGGIATTAMIIIGLMIIITMRRSLTKDGIDHFHLIAPPKKIMD